MGDIFYARMNLNNASRLVEQKSIFLRYYKKRSHKHKLWNKLIFMHCFVAGMSFSYILNIVLLFKLDIIHFILSLITNQVLIATLYWINRTYRLDIIHVTQYSITVITNYFKCVNSLMRFILYFIILLIKLSILLV